VVNLVLAKSSSQCAQPSEIDLLPLEMGILDGFLPWSPRTKVHAKTAERLKMAQTAPNRRILVIFPTPYQELINWMPCLGAPSLIAYD
jgi:hypothetical protein